MSIVFEPLQVGDLTLFNPAVIAPHTRCRAGVGQVPAALMAKYYVQRASAGLILSEATAVTLMGAAYPRHAGYLLR